MKRLWNWLKVNFLIGTPPGGPFAAQMERTVLLDRAKVYEGLREAVNATNFQQRNRELLEIAEMVCSAHDVLLMSKMGDDAMHARESMVKAISELRRICMVIRGRR